MKELPADVNAYQKSRVYTDRTTPGMMKNDHRTRAGVWGKIVVEKGEVVYEIPEDGETHTLTPDQPGVIEPLKFHRIDPQPGAKFYLELHRK